MLRAGFAKLLAFASDRGVFTVAVSPFKQSLSDAAGMVASPELQMQQNVLSKASCVAVKWTHATDCKLHPSDHTLIRHTQQRARALFRQGYIRHCNATNSLCNSFYKSDDVTIACHEQHALD